MKSCRGILVSDGHRDEPDFYHYDCPIRMPADIPLNFIPRDNTAFLLFVEAMKPTLREIIQAEPTFPHGKHDSKIECEFRLASFIGHMQGLDPTHHTPRWDAFNAATTTQGGPTPGGSGYYAVWFVRRLVDYLKVNRSRR